MLPFVLVMKALHAPGALREGLGRTIPVQPSHVVFGEGEAAQRGTVVGVHIDQVGDVTALVVKDGAQHPTPVAAATVTPVSKYTADVMLPKRPGADLPPRMPWDTQAIPGEPETAERPVEARTAASANTIFTEEARTAAAARLMALNGKLRGAVGQLPEGEPNPLKDLTILAGYHIERGVRNYPTFARYAVDLYGKYVRPYLRRAWDTALEKWNAARESVKNSAIIQEADHQQRQVRLRRVERWARARGLAQQVDFSDFHPPVAATLAREIALFYRRFGVSPPADTEFLGLTQQRNRPTLEQWLDESRQEIEKRDASPEMKQVWMEQEKKKLYQQYIESDANIAEHSLDAGSRGIALNALYANDRAKLSRELAKGVEAGYYLEGYTSLRAVIDHELAHELDRVYGGTNQ